MRTNWRQLAVVALTLAAAAPASAQDVKPAWAGDGPAIHRMEILDGRGGRRVQYFYYGLSPSEQAAIRDLELSENELAYVEHLVALRRDFLETQRAIEQQRLAALSGKFNIVLPPYTNPFIPSGSTSPAAPPYADLAQGALFPFGGTYSYYAAGAAGLAPFSAFSSGDDGVLRGLMAKQLADAANPDTLAQAYRHALNAEQTAAVVLKNPAKSNIRAAGVEQPDQGPRQGTGP